MVGVSATSGAMLGAGSTLEQADGRPRRAAQEPPGPTWRLPLPGRPRPRALRRQGELDQEAGAVPLLEPEHEGGAGPPAAHRPDRVARRPHRVGGAARRAEL